MISRCFISRDLSSLQRNAHARSVTRAAVLRSAQQQWRWRTQKVRSHFTRLRYFSYDFCDVTWYILFCVFTHEYDALKRCSVKGKSIKRWVLNFNLRMVRKFTGAFTNARFMLMHPILEMRFFTCITINSCCRKSNFSTRITWH